MGRRLELGKLGVSPWLCTDYPMADIRRHPIRLKYQQTTTGIRAGALWWPFGSRGGLSGVVGTKTLDWQRFQIYAADAFG